MLLALKRDSEFEDLDPDDTAKELLKYLERVWLKIFELESEQQLADAFRNSERNVTETVIDLTRTHLEKTEKIMQKLEALLANIGNIFSNL